MDTNTKAATTNAKTTGKKAGQIFSAICIAIMISIHTFQFFRAIQTNRPTRMEQQRLLNQVLEDQKELDPFDQLFERPAMHFDRNFGN